MTEKPDSLGWRLKIGIVVPSTNTIVQPEIDNLRISGVTCHVGRIPIQQKKISAGKGYLDHIQAMRAGIVKAIDEVMTCAPQHMIMSVALEAFWDGLEGATRLETELGQHTGQGVTIGSSAVRAALEACGARKIGVLTPHMPAGDEQIRSYFTQAGFEVVRLTGLECDSPLAIARVQQDDIRDNLLALDGSDVDALVQLGTNLAGADVAVELETAIGKPVIAINPATYWHALRSNGINDQFAGKGLIFERY